ncbi:MAG: ABC transporter permease [Phycisphaeraceae bacterium]|nr:MAG: ABC transporter permease [Phycisphaeraceae bacterium]
MRGLLPVFRRELSGYFITPVAYVFIVIFLILAGVFTFQMGQWYEANQADLRVFFNAHPWLYLFLIPALSMRLWAEERRGGTIELLLTLPVSRAGAVLGKYLAAWAFAALALALTFPLWITVNVLGRPDNAAIVAGYLGSAMMAGGFLAIGAAVSAATKSQIIAFILTVMLCFGFLLAGFAPVLDFFRGWAPAFIVDTVAGFSFLTRFDGIAKGVLQLQDVVFFGSLIAACLAANLIIVEAKKAA